MNLHQTHPQLYKDAIMTLLGTAVGDTGSLFDVGNSVQVFADPSFVCEAAEDVASAYIDAPFETVLSLTAQYRDREDAEVQRIIFVMANDNLLAVGFVNDPDEVNDFLADGDVEFEYGKNIFAYDSVNIGQVAKILREFTLGGILPDGNHSIMKEEA